LTRLISVPFTKTCPSFISTRFSILVTALLVANEQYSSNYSKNEFDSPSTVKNIATRIKLIVKIGVLLMANSTIRQADILLRECTVMQVATLDTDTGFPNIVSLTPLKSHRSLKEILFYTDRDTTTIQNVLEKPVVAVYCFNELHHSSLLLRAKAVVLTAEEAIPSFTESLNSFQKSLQYDRPVIIRCNPLTVKIRYNNDIEFSKLNEI